jgi:hypothetical protein
MGAVGQIRKIFCFASYKRSFSSQVNNFITVELAQLDLEIAAECQEYLLKLLEMDLKFKYTIKEKHLFELYRSKKM